MVLCVREGWFGSVAPCLGLQWKRSCNGSIAFSTLAHKLTTPDIVQPVSNGLTFPILKVRSPSFISIFAASSSSSAISMLSLDQKISVSGLIFPICGEKEPISDVFEKITHSLYSNIYSSSPYLAFKQNIAFLSNSKVKVLDEVRTLGHNRSNLKNMLVDLCLIHVK